MSQIHWYITGNDDALACYLKQVISPAAELSPAPKQSDLLVWTPALSSSMQEIENMAAGVVDLLNASSWKWLVMISSDQVYGKSEGDMLDESTHAWPATEVGRALARAEAELTELCGKRGVTLTILRAAPMFGSGMEGWGQQMFRRVAASRWFAIRQVDARRSIVTMYDVARAVALTFRQGGVFNVCDGADHTLLELATVMSANIGEYKRMPVLPLKWANLLAKLAGALPFMRKWAGQQIVDELQRSLTFSNQKLLQATGLTPFDTVEVLRGQAPDYPYSDKVSQPSRSTEPSDKTE